jgi:hypothetical protein
MLIAKADRVFGWVFVVGVVLAFLSGIFRDDRSRR